MWSRNNNCWKSLTYEIWYHVNEKYDNVDIIDMVLYRYTGFQMTPTSKVVHWSQLCLSIPIPCSTHCKYTYNNLCFILHWFSSLVKHYIQCVFVPLSSIHHTHIAQNCHSRQETETTLNCSWLQWMLIFTFIINMTYDD